MPLSAASASTELGPASNRRVYWRRVRWFTAALMLAWALVSFGVVFEARALSFGFFGWPFSFWWAAQGALLIFLALVGLYAWVMNRLDVRHDVDEHG
jgi:putative solute:sodium symporter small subunit